MKKYTILILLLSSCATTVRVSDVNINRDFPHDEIQRIAVLMLETSWHDHDKGKDNSVFSKTIMSPDAGSVLADIISGELVKWGRYIVMDRRVLEKELKLININEEDILQSKDYLSLGKSLSVDAVVIGKVEKFGISYRNISRRLVLSLTADVSFLARCIDVTTNEVVWSVEINGTSKEDNERSLAYKLVKKAVRTLKNEVK